MPLLPPDKDDEFAPGDLKQFMETLDDPQQQLFRKVRKEYNRQIRQLKQTVQATDVRDMVFEKVSDALGGMTASDVERGLREGLKKGDGQVLRVLMQAAGVDLSERLDLKFDLNNVVVNITPHDNELEITYVRVPDVAWKMIEAHLPADQWVFVKAMSHIPEREALAA